MNLALLLQIVNFAAKVLEIIQQHFGSVTSWQRSPARNLKVGGAPRSLHTVGLAMDVAFDTDEHKAAATKKLQAAGLHVLDEGDHLHIQDRPLK